MGSLVLTGNTSGSVTVAVPDVAGSNTATIGAATGTHYPFTASAVVTASTQTAIEFTAIPSWVKRITIMLSGLSTNNTGVPLVQLGTGSTTYTTSGYLSAVTILGASTLATANSTSGFSITNNHSAAYLIGGNIVLTNLTGNTWSCSGNTSTSNTTANFVTAGSVPLGAALTAIRLYIDGTQQFDAGSVNILFE